MLGVGLWRRVVGGMGCVLGVCGGGKEGVGEGVCVGKEVEFKGSGA